MKRTERSSTMISGTGRLKPMKRTGRSSTMISTNKTISQHVFRPFDLIHDDMALEVLARVAASSFDDFVHVKLSSKVFNELAESDYILQRVALQKFPVIPWHKNKETSAFITKCKNSGNPEALYRQGVIDFFDLMKLDSSVDNLTTAAKAGHMESLYALSIVFLLCNRDEFKQKGIDTLTQITSSASRSRIHECRKNLKAILKSLWIKNTYISKQEPICSEKQHKHTTRGWNEEYKTDCEACMIDYEIASIHTSLRLN